AQTSGGLLIAVTEERAAGFLADLQARGVEGARDIGRVTEGDGRIKVAS
nr:selenide, water dikinase SelD [Actinomycetota bacterium]